MTLEKQLIHSRMMFQVMANADTPEDALAARRNGAEGIGLCRTEHMVLAPKPEPGFSLAIFFVSEIGKDLWSSLTSKFFK